MIGRVVELADRGIDGLFLSCDLNWCKSTESW